MPYNHKPSESRDVVQGVYNYDADYNPQWEFGHGLSYTTFSYSNLKLSSDIIATGGNITVSVDVKNTGQMEGKETVELYLSDLYASITPDVKRLKGFEKISLKPGETKTVLFTIGQEHMSFVGKHNIAAVEPGEFRVEIAKLIKNFIVH